MDVKRIGHRLLCIALDAIPWAFAAGLGYGFYITFVDWAHKANTFEIAAMVAFAGFLGYEWRKFAERVERDRELNRKIDADDEPTAH